MTASIWSPNGSVLTESPYIVDVTLFPYFTPTDGVTDGVAGIVAAIAALKVRGGGVLLFPPGNYRAIFPTGLSTYYSLFAIPSNVTVLFMPGAVLSVTAVTGSLLFASVFGIDKTALPVNNVVFDSVAVTQDAIGVGQEGVQAISLEVPPDSPAESVTNVKIKNGTYNNFASAIYILQRTSVGSLTRQIRYVEITGNSGSGNVSYITADGADILISNNTVTGSVAAPATTFDAVSIHSGLRVKVIDNTFISYGEFGINVRNSPNNFCGSEDIKIARNTFSNFVKKAIGVYAVAGETVFGVRNVVVQENSVDTSSAVANTITGLLISSGTATVGTPFEKIVLVGNILNKCNSSLEITGSAAVRVSYLTASGNIIYAAAVNTEAALTAKFLDFSTIIGNTFHAEYNGAAYKATDVSDFRFGTIAGNAFYSASAYAQTLSFVGLTDSTVSGNQLYSPYIFNTLNNSVEISGNRFTAAGTCEARNFTGSWTLTQNRTIAYGTAAPATGTYKVGDLTINSVPTVGQPKSWVCTVAGSPGTHVSQGNL